VRRPADERGHDVDRAYQNTQTCSTACHTGNDAKEVRISAALEHPIGPNTVDDWAKAEHPEDGSRLELIMGYFHVSPAPSGEHQYTADWPCRALWDETRQSGRTDLYPLTAIGIKISTAWGPY
jgi:hypothetical protein